MTLQKMGRDTSRFLQTGCVGLILRNTAVAITVQVGTAFMVQHSYCMRDSSCHSSCRVPSVYPQTQRYFIQQGEAGSVAVLPWRYAPMGPGSIPSPGSICAFGFQSILASAGLLRVLRFSLLHLKPDFLNKSVSKRYIEASHEFNAFALLGFAWFSAECYKLNK